MQRRAVLACRPWSTSSFGLLEIHDLRADLGIDAAREREGVAVAGVESLGDVARELDVLALVVADRDDVGLVEQDVAGLSTGYVNSPAETNFWPWTSP